MNNRRFVYIPNMADLMQQDEEETPFERLPHGEAWGLFNDDDEREFIPLHVSGLHQIKLGESLGLYPEEVDAIIEPDDSNTPDEAWAALARYRLL